MDEKSSLAALATVIRSLSSARATAQSEGILRRWSRR